MYRCPLPQVSQLRETLTETDTWIGNQFIWQMATFLNFLCENKENVSCSIYWCELAYMRRRRRRRRRPACFKLPASMALARLGCLLSYTSCGSCSFQLSPKQQLHIYLSMLELLYHLATKISSSQMWQFLLSNHVFKTGKCSKHVDDFSHYDH